MALSVLISAQLTRMFPSLLLLATRHVLDSCVGVWQNDRVEIIANDRAFFLRIVFTIFFYMNVLQRAIAPHLPMSRSLPKSV